MKQKIYIRIGKGKKIKVDARTNPVIDPLKEGTDRFSKSIPTVYFTLDLEIPDEAFSPPNICASVKVPIEILQTSIEVIDPMKIL